jgi:hypothetical protein
VLNHWALDGAVFEMHRGGRNGDLMLLAAALAIDKGLPWIDVLICSLFGWLMAGLF